MKPTGTVLKFDRKYVYIVLSDEFMKCFGPFEKRVTLTLWDDGAIKQLRSAQVGDEWDEEL